MQGALALEVDITADEIGLQPAMKRARRAAQLADRIREFAQAAPVPQAAHLAWLLLSKCVDHALSFDERVAVESALWPAMHAILSVDLDDTARRGMRISGAFGGCGLRGEASGASANAANYTAWLSKASRVLAIVECSTWAGRSRGVMVGRRLREHRRGCAEQECSAASDGAVGLEKEAAAEHATSASAWQADQPISQQGRFNMEEKMAALQIAPQSALARLSHRLVSRIYKHLDAVEAAALWHGADSVMRETMLSSGGMGAGGLWIAMPYRNSDEFFGTAHFRCATLLRLGEVKPPSGATCKLQKCAVQEGERQADPGAQARGCGRVFGPRDAHAFLGKAEPTRMRPHRHLAAVLCRELRAIGAEVDMERVVPELVDRRPQTPAEKRDTVLDLVVPLSGGIRAVVD